jgi:hypothetical protein
MSWSVNYIGKPADIIAALKKDSEKATGNSKTEFDKALPNLISLLEGNYHSDEQYIPVLQLSASGHTWTKEDGQPGYGSITVTLVPLPAQLV